MEGDAALNLRADACDSATKLTKRADKDSTKLGWVGKVRLGSRKQSC